MVQLVGTASNVFAVINRTSSGVGEHAKIQPMAEIVLNLVEAEYEYDSTGQSVKRQKVSSVRFCTHPNELRKLALVLRAVANDAEEHCRTLIGSVEDVVTEEQDFSKSCDLLIEGHNSVFYKEEDKDIEAKAKALKGGK